ncbi:MAG: DNA replication and repair protein RecF, partial [Oscillospiraceae bacterium]
MIINSLKLTNFRNFAKTEFSPCESVNIIYGDNAQGKTNLLEAIWLFTGAKSFRGAKDLEYINFKQDFCTLDLDFFANKRQQNAQIKITKNKKTAFLNDIEKTSVTKLAGEFLCVAFSPVDLSLIKDSPSLRRKFIDGAIGQLTPKYISYLGEYTKVLNQRNALLKDIKYNSSLYEMLDLWDTQLQTIGANIIFLRNKYLNNLREKAIPIYSGIADLKEVLDIKYSCSFDGYIDNMELEQIKDIYHKRLKDTIKQDIVLGSTSIGVHRDDIDFFVDNKSLRSFGSQGKQRSCFLALKLD